MDLLAVLLVVSGALLTTLTLLPSTRALIMPKPLDRGGLDHIKNHMYVGGKYTPLDNILNPFWYWATEQIPLWLAPNLITLTGFFGIMTSLALYCFHDADYTHPQPAWCYILCGFLLWFYQTLDAMDGKQARRTGASSPLGQLFDHGCDCLTGTGLHTMCSGVLLVGPNMWTMTCLLVFLYGFHLAQWKEYHTGVLETAVGPVGVTEAQYFIMGIQVVAGVLGVGTLRQPTPFVLPAHEFFARLGFPTAAGGVLLVNHAICIGFIGFVCFACTVTLLGGLRGLKEADGMPLADGLKQLVPMTALMVMACCWPTDVLAAQPRLLVLSTALIGSHLTNQMIIFSMAKMPFPMFQLGLLPYAALLAGCHLGLSELVLPVGLPCLLVFSLGRMLVWVSVVIGQITARLGIHCFTIPPPKAN